MPTHTPDKRRLKGEKTRQIIIEAALEIILTQGKEGLTARALAKKAGVAKASLFHHFQNMNEITFAALELIFHELVQRYTTDEFDCPHEMLLSFGMRILDESENFKNIFKGFFSLLDEVFVNPELRTRMLKIFEEFVDTMKKSFHKFSGGTLTEEELDGIALALSIMLDVISLYLILFDDRERFENMWRQITRIFIHYINERRVEEENHA